MRFLVQWTGEPTRERETTERFLKTGGRPPEGVRMLGRWHAIGESRGVAIAETDDLTALSLWVLQWNDLLTFKISPALTDEEAGAALAANRAAAP
ncbi:MAG: DUF3303 family protein [Paraburkholderia sp.]|nr:DUF3303 family protein [Paraburkholderia sp.]MDE1179071.1 DUF3303 family protein [Paraburkholderia sp.]